MGGGIEEPILAVDVAVCGAYEHSQKAQKKTFKINMTDVKKKKSNFSD